MCGRPISTLAGVGMINTFRSQVRFRKFSFDPVDHRLRKMVSVEESRRIAKRRLPHGVFDYIDGGAEDERTLATQRRGVRPAGVPSQRAARRQRDRPRPRRLRSRPGVAAGAGAHRLHPDRPFAGRARGRPRRRAGRAFRTRCRRWARARSRRSPPSATAPSGSRCTRGRTAGLVAEMVERAAAAGYEAIWLTVDTAVLGRRERDARRGFTLPPKIGPSTIIDGIVHPGMDVRLPPRTTRSRSPTSPVTASTERRQTSGPRPVRDQPVRPDAVVVRRRMAAVGVGRPDRAQGHPDRRRRQAGGRGRRRRRSRCRTTAAASSTMRRRRSRSSSRSPRPSGPGEIICDGGVRRGSDIVKAIALGATRLLDRAALPVRDWAPPASAGSIRSCEFFRDGIARTMALSGVAPSPRSTATSSAGAPEPSLACEPAHSCAPKIPFASGFLRPAPQFSDANADWRGSVRWCRAAGARLRRHVRPCAHLPRPTASPTSASTVPTSATRSTARMFQAIAEAGEQLKSEPGLRAVVLSGEGAVVLRRARLLVVPGDGRRRRRAPASARRASGEATPATMTTGAITHLGQQVCWVWQELPVPVIAAVHGHALGGGLQIALGADIRIVHPDTQAVGPRGPLGSRARHDRHVHPVAARPSRRRQGADVHGASVLRHGGRTSWAWRPGSATPRTTTRWRWPSRSPAAARGGARRARRCSTA